jgi:hypothetical protein
VWRENGQKRTKYLGLELTCYLENDGGVSCITTAPRGREVVLLYQLVVNQGLQIMRLGFVLENNGPVTA